MSIGSMNTGSRSTTPAAPASAAELGDELVHLLKAMERTSAQIAARRKDSVDKGAFTVLFRLVHDGPQRSGALAEATLADPSTVSRHVAHLVSKGLVERTADPVDGRATVLAVTERGRACAHTIRERRNAAIATIVVDWSPDDRSQFTALLTRFTRDLERQRPQLLAQSEQLADHEGES